ncbi:MAG: lysophospholipid acyltransferase family protein [Syntrophales bacterium]|nr:lysophospholipid acyltransferase family protein [Syntrophales bacterium]
MKPYKIQQVAGTIGVFVVAPLYFLFLRLMGYRIRDLKRLRSEWKALLREHPGPWLICPNHLTMIDSLILTYGILSLKEHFFRFDRVPWNLPERANFNKHLVLRVLCYLAKCLPVSRGGDRDEMKKTLEACSDLLASKQSILIFPEGGRSRTGRINGETYSYGVGRFIADHPDCRVLCVYLRGDRQESYGTFPPRDDDFTMMLSAFVPERGEAQGLRAQRNYAGQIIGRLIRMEEDYFATHRQRYRRSERAGEHEENPGSAFSQPRLHA